MKPAIFNSIKRPFVVGIVSGACCAAIVLLWVKFPSLVPVIVLIVCGIATAATFLVAEVIVALRIARMLMRPRQSAEPMRKPSSQALTGLVVALVLCNGGLLYFYHFRPNLEYILLANAAIVVSWLVTRFAAVRYVERRSGARMS